MSDEQSKARPTNPADEDDEQTAAVDPLDQFLAKRAAGGAVKPGTPAPTAAAPPASAPNPPPSGATAAAPAKPTSEAGKKDLLQNLPPELAALGVKGVADRPVSRPVLWGQNKDATKAEQLDTNFVDTEKERLESLDEIPIVTLDDLKTKDKKKKDE